MYDAPIRILYLDDYPLDRELVRDALSEYGGFELVEVASREEFEAQLADCDYDLVLSDFNILGFEGLQVLAAVQEVDPRVPVVLVTGTGTEEVAVAAMRRGVADYVLKTPEHIRRLPRTIQAALEAQRLRDEREQAEAALARRAGELAALYRTSLEINAQPDLETLLLTIVRRATVLIGTQVGGLFLLQPDGETLELVAGYNQGGGYVGATLRLGEGLAGRVAQSGEPLQVANYSRWEGRAGERSVGTIGRILGAPLKRGAQVIGVLNLFDIETAGEFGADDVRLLELFAAQAAVAIENARLFEQVRAGRQRLGALSRQLVEVQETERRSLARELHDQVGQILSAAKLHMQTVVRSPAAQALAPELEQGIAIVERGAQRVRQLSLDLRPSVLDDFGLEPALRWYLERQAELADFAVELDADPLETRLPPELETTCFRIVQAAVTNAELHAGAQQVRVEVRLPQAAELELVIRDDGQGFDVPAALQRAARGESMGLLGMQERAELVGGRLEITSALGGGTEVRALFPLSEDGTLERRRQARG